MSSLHSLSRSLFHSTDACLYKHRAKALVIRIYLLKDSICTARWTSSLTRTFHRPVPLTKFCHLKWVIFHVPISSLVSLIYRSLYRYFYLFDHNTGKWMHALEILHNLKFKLWSTAWSERCSFDFYDAPHSFVCCGRRLLSNPITRLSLVLRDTGVYHIFPSLM